MLCDYLQGFQENRILERTPLYSLGILSGISIKIGMLYLQGAGIHKKTYSAIPDLERNCSCRANTWGMISCWSSL